ncbi:pentapeptide repeat-containing protein [Nocardia flavorosea]|uniref:pentapeptide repeat-containing protein n=1 Tax=Nocardia flavorosea TaxID=53429 RepID=UPI0018951ABB|nr:pentapeptide repeat-containing protein [Nocardia flavorosea]
MFGEPEPIRVVARGRRGRSPTPARRSTRLTHARLTHARLTHARLTHARLTHARLTHADTLHVCGGRLGSGAVPGVFAGYGHHAGPWAIAAVQP